MSRKKDPAMIAPEAERGDPTPSDLLETLAGVPDPTPDMDVEPEPPEPEPVAPAVELPTRKAAAAPKEPAKDPAPKEPVPEVPGASGSSIDPARFAALEQTLNDMRSNWSKREEGLLGEIMELREDRRQLRLQQEQRQRTEEPKVPDRVPIQFDEKGQPYLTRDQVQQWIRPQNVDPVQSFNQNHHQMVHDIVMQDPVGLAAPARRFEEARMMMDQTLSFLQKRTGRATPDLDAAMDLLESTGAAKRFMEAFGDVAKDERDLQDLLLASTGLNSRRVTGVIRRIKGYQDALAQPKAEEEPAVPVKGDPPAGGGGLKKPGATPERRMGDLGRGAGTKPVDSGPAINDLESILDWTPEKRKAFLAEAHRIDSGSGVN